MFPKNARVVKFKFPQHYKADYNELNMEIRYGETQELHRENPSILIILSFTLSRAVRRGERPGALGDQTEVIKSHLLRLERERERAGQP